jgi:hypothetical protein
LYDTSDAFEEVSEEFINFCCEEYETSSNIDTSDAFEEASEEFINFCCDEYETSSNISVNEDSEVGEVL